MESGKRGRFIEFTDLFFFLQEKQSNNVFKRIEFFDYYFFFSLLGVTSVTSKLLILEGLPANLEYFLTLSLFFISTVGSSPLDTLSLFLKVEADVDWNIWSKPLFHLEVFCFF